jgi:hypothetical protein
MTKEDIITEIQRTARENNNVPLGISKFFQATGIKNTDWTGKYWARWGDAIREAGFSPNLFPTHSVNEDSDLLEKYIALTREMGRFPVKTELQLHKRTNKAFPNEKKFLRRFGSKIKLIDRLAQYCENRPGYEDIIALCAEVKTESPVDNSDVDLQTAQVGFVYLIQHGSKREYKIGKTFNPLRREGEIRLQLPEKIEPIHYIETDDPSGIENYWHNRFADKRKNGEWFALTSADVQAFKKWRRIN